MLLNSHQNSTEALLKEITLSMAICKFVNQIYTLYQHITLTKNLIQKNFQTHSQTVQH